MKTLLLFNPVNRFGQRGLSATKSLYPPLGLGIIAALTPENWKVEIIDGNIEEVIFPDADLVGITSNTATAPEMYRIATIYRNRKIPVVLGGIHVSMLPDEAISYADAVVIGEAESVWSNVLEDFEKNSLKKFYVASKINPENIPIPSRNLFNKNYNLDTIQASRGCPNNCDYCSVTLFNGKEFRMRPVENVVNDIEKMTANFFWFGDDNLFGNSSIQSEWAISLFKEMVNRKISKLWLCFASCQACKNEEVLEWAARAGCVSVYLGIESDVWVSFKTINKKVNKPKEYKKVFSLMHKYNITVFAGIMLGFDNDTKESIYRRTEFIINSDIDSYFVSVLTPLPRTVFYNKLTAQKRLIHTNFPEDWVLYNWTNLVHKPYAMEFTEAEKAINMAYEKLYDLNTIKQKYDLTLSLTKNEVLSQINLNTNMDCRELFLLRK